GFYPALAPTARRRSLMMFAWLLDCPAPTPEQQRKGRWLNGLVLIFCALALGIIINGLLTNQLQFLLADLVTTALLLLLYLINRRGFYTAASIMLVSVLSAAIIGPMFVLPLGLEV